MNDGTLWWFRHNSETAILCRTIHDEEQMSGSDAIGLYGEDLRLIWLPSWGTNLETQMAAELFYFTIEWTEDDGLGEDRQNLPVFYHNGPLETFLGPNSTIYKNYLRLVDESPTTEELTAMSG